MNSTRLRALTFNRGFDPTFWRRYQVEPYHGGAPSFVTANKASKLDLPLALHRRLKRNVHWLPDVIMLGSSHDPYPPVERRERVTRRLIEVIAHHACSLCIVTNSPIILRDIDLIHEVHERAQSTVVIKLPSARLKRSRAIDRGGPAPFTRLRILERLRHGGVNTGIIVTHRCEDFGESVAELELIFKRSAELNLAFVIFPEMYWTPDQRRVNVELGRQILELSRLYGVKIRVKRYLPDDFRHENYWLAEQLANAAYRQRLSGGLFKPFLAAAKRVNSLKVDVRNIIRQGELGKQDWVPSEARGEFTRLLDGSWAVKGAL